MTSYRGISDVRGSPNLEGADMKLSTVLAATMFLSVVSLAAALPATATDSPSTDNPVSNVRIVRLSEVRGTVQVDRAIGRGFEPAVTNLPIIEQSKVQTGTGVAEIEFEDNSTLRIGPDSMVEFPQLGRTATGATTSTVRLAKGTAYASLMKSRTDEFTLLFGNRKITLPPGAHIRLAITQDKAKLAVLAGPLRIDESAGTLEVRKKQTVTFDLTDHNEPMIAKNIGSAPLDQWDKQAAEYHARAAAFGAFNSPYAYGLSDMAYYGAFHMSSSCGLLWRPYFASAAWDPYSNGAWAWYPNSGYSWVSPYPWGWTPYHYGSWAFCPNTGWGWAPGGAWNGLRNVTGGPTQKPGPKPIGPPKPVRPPKPVHPPRPGQPTILAVNTKPLVRSGIASLTAFQFRRDSAGLGIPRQTLGKLNKLSEHVVSRGVASTPIYLAGPRSSPPMPVRGGTNRSANTGHVMPTMHRGYAPSAPAQSGSSGGMRGASPSASSVSMPSSSAHASAPSSGGGGSHH